MPRSTAAARVAAASSGLARLVYPPTLATVQAPGWILRNVLVAVLLAGIVLRPEPPLDSTSAEAATETASDAGPADED